MKFDENEEFDEQKKNEENNEEQKQHSDISDPADDPEEHAEQKDEKNGNYEQATASSPANSNGNSVGNYSSFSYDYSTKNENKKKKNNTATVLVISGIVVGILLLLSAIAGLASSIKTGTLSPDANPTVTPTEVLTGEQPTGSEQTKTGTVIYNDKDEWINDGNTVSGDAIVNATYHVIDSVVAITTEVVSYNPFYGNYVSKGAGSGVIIAEKQDDDGKAVLSYIITNNHVIDGASSIVVTLSNGDTHEATLVGTDSQTDIAVLTIKAVGLPKAMFGSSSSLKLGQSVIAIGNPLGSLAGTVTSGIISGLEREITIDGVDMTLLQTSAAINPGNSGGGLFDLDGKLIGIVNAKSSGTNIEGLGFAIPADIAKSISSDIIENGYVSGRCMIGINGTMVTADNYSSFQNSELYTDYIYKYYKAYGSLLAGFYVADDEGVNYAPDTKEKFKYGDIIAEIGSVKVQDTSSITAALSKYSVGDTVTVRVYRLVEEEVSSIFGGTRKQTTIKSFDISVILSEYEGQ